MLQVYVCGVSGGVEFRGLAHAVQPQRHGATKTKEDKRERAISEQDASLGKNVVISCEVLVLRAALCPTNSKHRNAADGFEAK